MYIIGTKVRFKGRPQEIHKYHPDFAQLIGQVGTVVSAESWAPILARCAEFYEVRFDGFTYEGAEADGKQNVFTCWDDELEAVE